MLWFNYKTFLKLSLELLVVFEGNETHWSS